MKSKVNNPEPVLHPPDQHAPHCVVPCGAIEVDRRTQSVRGLA